MANFERGSALLALLALLLLGAVPAGGQAKKPGTAGGAKGVDRPSICDAIPGNLVQNCGFETGDFTDWTATGADTFVASDCDSSVPGVYGPNSGTYSACLGEVNHLGFVSQTITDTPGKNYILTFWLKSDGQTPNEFQVSYNGTVLTDMSNLSAFGYTQFSFSGLIGTGSDTIKFGGRNDPEYLNLDDVSFVQEAGAVLVDYFANANTTGAPDATVRIVDPGTSDDPTSNGKEAAPLCALIYVFDANQQLSECCGCSLSANALATLSVNNNLTANPLLGTKLHTGVIKIVSSAPGPSCDPTTIIPIPALRAWATHVQNKVGVAFPATEGESQSAALGLGEQADLAEDCKVLEELGSGAGVCKCPAGH